MADDSAEFDTIGPTDVLGSTEVVESMTSTANLPTDLLTDVATDIATSALYDADAATVSLTRQCPKCGLMFSSEYDRCPVDNHALQGISVGLGGSLMARELSEGEHATNLDAFDETDVQRIRDSELLGAANDETMRGSVLENRFYVEELIGEGGMGRVYRGSQLSVGRPVAIKMLHRRISNEPSIRERFNREARLVSGFSHPNTVRLIDFGEAEGHLYMVMELVDGVSLQQFAGRGPLSVPFALEVLRQVCGPLAEAHKADVVHRDLKPENIYVARTADGRLQIKLLDFGVAHIDPSSAEEQADTYRELTRQGVVVGTPEYMSPEQARGEVVTKATDVYALGVILYQMLSGRLPFYGQTPMHTMFQLVTKPVPPITGHVPNCPLPLVELLELLLQKQPERRIDNVVEVARRLREVRNSLGLEPMTELPDGDLRAVLEAVVFQNTAMPDTDEYQQPKHRLRQDTEKDESPRRQQRFTERQQDPKTLPSARPAAGGAEESDAFDEDAPTAVVQAADVKVLRDSQPQEPAAISEPVHAPVSSEPQLTPESSGASLVSSASSPVLAPDSAPERSDTTPTPMPAPISKKLRTKPMIEPTAEVATSSSGGSSSSGATRARAPADPTRMQEQRPYVPPEQATVVSDHGPSRGRVLLLTFVLFVFVAASGYAIFKLAAQTDTPPEPPPEKPPPTLPREITKPRVYSNPPVVPEPVVADAPDVGRPDAGVEQAEPKPKPKPKSKSKPKPKPEPKPEPSKDAPAAEEPKNEAPEKPALTNGATEPSGSTNSGPIIESLD